MKKKDIIVERSYDLFLTLGFKNVTMDDIANDMGISKKTIYAHFKNKTKLVESVAFQLFENTRHGIDHISRNTINPIEKLYLVKLYVMHQLNNENQSPRCQLRKYYPRIHNTLICMQYEKMQRSVLESLEYGIQTGVFRSTIDTDFISRIYFIGMMGIKDHIHFPQKTYKMTYLMKSYLEYHLKAIVTEKGTVLLNELITTTANRHK